MCAVAAGIACAVAAGRAAPTDAENAASAVRAVEYPIRTMGTYANVTLVTADSAASSPVARAALAAFTRVDSLMSNWTTTSEVARVNRVAATAPTQLEPEVATVVEKALRVWKDSDGAQDITVEPLVRLWGFLGGPKRVPAADEVREAFAHVGSQKLRYDAGNRSLGFAEPGVKIDLGGIAKGYAVDVAAGVLRGAGVENALVDLSGNMVALGRPAGAEHWRIGIRDPRDRMRHFARLPLSGEAIATSGKYEQFVAEDGRTYGHIMDPRTGRPADGLISVTVVAATAMDADAWDTALFVLGPDAAKRKAREREDIAVVLVQPGVGGVDTVWVESALEKRFLLDAAAAEFFRVRYF